ncbi:hypothetical protein RJ639_031731 [Escallonia herrerae]|uniref:Peptidase A1 domain-containing protein n=1 Tax=Escallonia herrerae TaxID=1293975 RepID=A0AA88WZG4_9ASTE|nr:hypothetical protein RJ639_031731 [Escallonia herrerae]
METNSLLGHNAKLVLVIMAFLLSTNITNSVATSPNRFVANLIHHDSILSPFYNATATIADRANQSLGRSIARLSYLKAATKIETPANVRGLVLAGTGSFLVSMSIGEPQVHQFLYMDTASDLVWLHCIPCTGCHTDNAIFNPSLSSTYYPLPCNYDSYCAEHCNHEKNWCLFLARYADEASATGNFAEEKFTFSIANEGITTARNVLFGCGREINEPNREINGVMGLGYGEESLAKQLGNKFSYCIGNIADRNYMHNRLIIGNGAVLVGGWTPLVIRNDLYYLRFESIKVGHRTLAINPRVFQRTPQGRRGLIIDSGTENTYLIRDAYLALIDTVKEIIGGELRRSFDPQRPTTLCYIGRVNRDLTTFPVVEFHFRGGAFLKWRKENLFETISNTEFCLTVDIANGNMPKDVSAIGAFAQQFHNIGYDLSAQMLYIDRMDCETDLVNYL